MRLQRDNEELRKVEVELRNQVNYYKNIEEEFRVLRTDREHMEKYYQEIIASLEMQISELRNVKSSAEGTTLHLEELIRKL